MDHATAAVAEFLNLAKDLPAGTFISVPAQIATKVIDGYKLANRNKRGAASLVQHTCDLMVPLVRAAATHSKEELGETLNEELETLPKLLTDVRDGMVQITGRSTFARLMKRGDDKQLIEDLSTKLRQRLHTFQVKGLLNLQVQQNVNEQARREGHAQTHAVLDTYQAEIHARFDRLEITTAVVTRARASPLRQAVSPHFTGRDELVAQAVAVVTGTLQPHLSFFGTGGIGKTSMALAVAHHEDCVRRFRDYRYFVECEALTSASAVRSSILHTLAGSSSAPSKGDPRQLLTDMLSVDHPILLIIDNFETPWNAAGQRSELTELLKQMAAMPHVRLITTLRSDDAPATGDVAWTRVPVKVLELRAARHLFLLINPTTNQREHEDLDLLLKEVDCLPLAVKLLAELKKQQNCSELLRRWQDTKTSLVKTERQGGTRLTSLDISISLSLHSPLLDDAARDLLATICQLPAGVIGGRPKLKAMAQGLLDFDAKLDALLDDKVDALLEVALLTDDRETDRLTIAPPIRAYVSLQSFHAYEDTLELFYVTQIEHWEELSMGDAEYVEKQDALLAEVHNIRYFFQHRMISHPSLRLGEALYTFTAFEYLLRPSMQLITCLTNQLTRIGWEEHRPYCVLRIARIYLMLSRYTEAEAEFRAAHAQFVKIGDRRGTAQCLYNLAELYRVLSRFTEAEADLKAAQAQFVEIGDRCGTAQCHQSLGNMHSMLNKYTEAEAELTAAHAQFVEIEDRFGTAQCLRSLGDIHRMVNKYPEGEAELNAAHAQFVEIGDRLGTAQCLHSLGDLYKTLTKYTEAEDKLKAARAQFVEIGDVRGSALCLRTLGIIHCMLSKHTEAEAELTAAHAQLVEIGDRHGTAQCLKSLGDTHTMLKKYTEAEAELTAAQVQFAEIGDRNGTAQCLHSLGELYKTLTKFTEAVANLKAARAQYVEIGDRRGSAYCLLSSGNTHCILSNHTEAEAELTAAQAQFVEIEDRLGAAECLRGLGNIHIINEKYTEAEAELTAAQALFVEIEYKLGTAQCLRGLSIIHSVLKKYTEAEAELTTAHAQSVEVGDMLGTAQCLQSLAKIFCQQQRWEEAETLLAEAESIATAIDNRHEQARICGYRGGLYRARGRHDEARAQFTLSHDLFLSIGLATDAEDVLRESEDWVDESTFSSG